MKCKECGKQFISASENHVFCNVKCMEKHFGIVLPIAPQTRQNKISKFTNEDITDNIGYYRYWGEERYINNDLIKQSKPKATRKPRVKKNSFYLTQTLQDIKRESENLRSTFGERKINTWLTKGFTESLKLAILKRDGYKCYICGKKSNLHIHHIIPRAEGGPHTPENLVTLCAGCHRSIESGDVFNAIDKCVARVYKNYEG